MMAAGFVSRLQLPEFVSAINHSETTAPFIDPTMYRLAARRLQLIKEMAQALIPFQKASTELRELVLKEEVDKFAETNP